jgi:arginine-tRNA-protein transferase
MSIQDRLRPVSFLVTTETPCPYLPGRQERKIVTDLSTPGGAGLYEVLSRAGFRRSHSIAYRPACSGCHACVPVRVVVAGFEASRSVQRIERRNADLLVRRLPPQRTSEQFVLFSRYLDGRHKDGDMAGMSFGEYGTMIEDSPLDTFVIECRDAADRLLACCLADRTRDGLSAVYSFFEPSAARRSLGTFMVIRLIRDALAEGLSYVYLGYWVPGSRKMAYKARFRPMEALGPHGWTAADFETRNDNDDRRQS